MGKSPVDRPTKKALRTQISPGLIGKDGALTCYGINLFMWRVMLWRSVTRLREGLKNDKWALLNG